MTTINALAGRILVAQLEEVLDDCTHSNHQLFVNQLCRACDEKFIRYLERFTYNLLKETVEAAEQPPLFDLNKKLEIIWDDFYR